MTTHAPRRARFAMIALQEFRLLGREPALWMVGLLFLALVVYATVNGLAQTAARHAAQAAVQQADQSTRSAQRALLLRMLAGTDAPKPFENPANPAVMASSYGGSHALLPGIALAPVALGQSDLFPSQFKVTHQSRVVFMNPSDIESPWHLLSGHFDLAFVLIYVLPLLIFALSYNLLSGERESGTLRLLLSQPLHLRTLVAGKLAARAVALLLPSVVVPACVLLLARWWMGEPAGGGAGLLWWAALVGAYALFWFALVVAVNAFGASSATNAMVLVIAWVLLVLVVPVLLNLGVTTASPAPSRTELATRTRVVTAEAMSKHADLMSTDYQHVGRGALLLPKDGKIEIAGRALGNYRIQRDVDAAIQPDLDRFDRQSARQQALVARFAILSPAAVAYEGMTGLAGTGGRRHARFAEQTTQFHRQWKDFFFPRIDARAALSAEDFDAIPRFAWREEPPSVVRRHALVAVVQLLLPGLLLLLLATLRLRRFSVA